MYTSFGKANDRFGFEDKGEFYCAFKTDSLIITISAAVMLVWIVLIIINFVTFAVQMSNTGAYISQSMNEIIYGSEDATADSVRMTTWGAAIQAGATMTTTVLGLIILAFMGIIFIVIEMRLHRGVKHTFKADDRSFTISFPPKMNKEDLVLEYDDILGITWERRKFPLAPECFDFTIKTRTHGIVEIRMILHKLARVNGVTETPFNYIREKIGTANADERYLINRGIK